MVYPVLSGNPSPVPVTASCGVTLVGLVFVAIFSLGAGLTGVGFGHLVPMVPTVPCLGETAV